MQAVEHLVELENKIKIKNDIQNIHVLETAQKAQQFVEQSKNGYQKYN